MLTSSHKEKMKLWKFENGVSKCITSVPCLGGTGGGYMDFMRTKAKELVVISVGNASNKVELFTLLNN